MFKIYKFAVGQLNKGKNIIKRFNKGFYFKKHYIDL